jgi:hypothetical protein
MSGLDMPREEFGLVCSVALVSLEKYCITLATENCTCVTTTLNNISALNLSGAINKGQWGKVVMDYFLEDDRAMLTLSDSENESDDEEIPDLGKNMSSS